MRFMVLTLALLPAGVQAQTTALPNPATEQVAVQACPAGMGFDTTTQSCGLIPAPATSPAPTPAVSGGMGCGSDGMRDVSS